MRVSGTGGLLVRGAATRVAAMAITVVTGLVMLPILVHALGDRMYGAWVLVGTVLGYYGLLDLGLSSAVSRFVSRALGEGDRREADACVASSVCLFSAAAVVVLAVTLAVYLLRAQLTSDPGEAAVLGKLLLIMGAAFALAFPTRPFEGVLLAHLRYDLLSLLSIVATLVRAALIIWVLSVGGGILALAIVSAAVNLARSLAVVACAWRVHGTVLPNLLALTRTRLRSLLGYSVFTSIAQVADLLRMRAWPFVVSTFIGMPAITTFSIGNQMSEAISQMCASASSLMTPVFSRQEGSRDLQAMRRAYLLTYKVSCYLVVFLVAWVAAFGRDVLIRWMGSEHLASLPVLNVLLLAVLFGAAQIPTVNLLYGVSRHDLYAGSNIAQGVLTVGLSIVLAKPLGLMGIAWGVAVPMVVVKLLVQPRWACRVLEMSAFEYYVRHTLPNLLKPGLFGAVLLWLGPRVSRPDYIHLAAAAAVSTVAYTAYAFYVGFDSRERRLLLDSVARALSARRAPESEIGSWQGPIGGPEDGAPRVEG